MPDIEPRRGRSWLGVALSAAVGTTSVLLGAHLLETSRAEHARDTLLQEIHADVLALRGEYDATAAVIDEQIRYGSHVLGWMLEVELGGSAGLLEGLQAAGQRVEIRPGPTLTGVVGHGAPHDLDEGLRRALHRLYGDADRAARSGTSAHEAYLLAVDSNLDAAVWYSAFDVGPDPARVVDYGTAMRALRDGPVPGALRHQLRALEERAAAFRSVAEATGAVLAQIEAALD